MADFIYPYNFVPSAGSRRPPNDRLKRGRVGGNLEFCPIDTYTGKSGRIEFTLTNVSPLFVPDSEHTSYRRIRGEGEHFHKIMDFFNVEGLLAIPGTSIRGMLRSVAEAVSNSSFGVFEPAANRFTFRKVRNLGNGVRDLVDRKWGRWIAGGNGELRVRQLKSAKLWRENLDLLLGLAPNDDRGAVYRELRGVNVNADLWQLHTGHEHVRRFSFDWQGATLVGEVFPATPWVPPGVVASGGWIAGGSLRPRAASPDKTEVLFNGISYRGPSMTDIRKSLGLRGRPTCAVDFQLTDAVPSARGRQIRVSSIRIGHLQWEARSSAHTSVAGVLWPHSGFGDLDSAGRSAIHYISILIETPDLVPVASEALEYYRHAHPTAREPVVGDIVRYYATGGHVVELGPCAMFKTPEEASVTDVAERTREIFLPTSAQRLCPSSRLFGWTPSERNRATQQNATHEQESEPGVASRVRVMTAWGDKRLDETLLVPLQILGSPKPQYYPFYLKQENAPIRRSGAASYYTRADQPAGWSPVRGVLRGRKFYLHKPVAIQHPETGLEGHEASVNAVRLVPEMVQNPAGAENADCAIRSHQNVTAAVLPPGGIFRGSIEFDSLDDHEIGLLLWALSLSDDPSAGTGERGHKLGLGRPIGLGSMRVSNVTMILRDPLDGWREATNGTALAVTWEQAAFYVRVFKTWMLTGEERADDAIVAAFNTKPFFEDLKALLAFDFAGTDYVGYFAPDLPAYEAFKYFVTERGKRHENGEEPLRTPLEIGEGLRQR